VDPLSVLVTVGFCSLVPGVGCCCSGWCVVACGCGGLCESLGLCLGSTGSVCRIHWWCALLAAGFLVVWAVRSSSVEIHLGGLVVLGFGLVCLGSLLSHLVRSTVLWSGWLLGVLWSVGGLSSRCGVGGRFWLGDIQLVLIHLVTLAGLLGWGLLFLCLGLSGSCWGGVLSGCCGGILGLGGLWSCRIPTGGGGFAGVGSGLSSLESLSAGVPLWEIHCAVWRSTLVIPVVGGVWLCGFWACSVGLSVCGFLEIHCWVYGCGSCPLVVAGVLVEIPWGVFGCLLVLGADIHWEIPCCLVVLGLCGGSFGGLSGGRWLGLVGVWAWGVSGWFLAVCVAGDPLFVFWLSAWGGVGAVAWD